MNCGPGGAGEPARRSAAASVVEGKQGDPGVDPGEEVGADAVEESGIQERNSRDNEVPGAGLPFTECGAGVKSEQTSQNENEIQNPEVEAVCGIQAALRWSQGVGSRMH